MCHCDCRYCSTACQQRAWHSHHKFECVIQPELDHMCEQLPAVAQQELTLLVRVALKAMAPPPECQSSGARNNGAEGAGTAGEGVCQYTAGYEDVLAMPSHDLKVQSLDPQVFSASFQAPPVLARASHSVALCWYVRLLPHGKPAHSLSSPPLTCSHALLACGYSAPQETNT